MIGDRQHWIDQHAERDAVYANRRRIEGERGQLLMRLRGELLERPNAGARQYSQTAARARGGL